jgi:hypothetical protein
MNDYIEKSIKKNENNIGKLKEIQQKIDKDGLDLSILLTNTEVFKCIDEKENFLHSIMMSIKEIENVKVEREGGKNKFYFVCPLGEFFFLDFENKSYNRKEGFLEKGYWIKEKEYYEIDLVNLKKLLNDLNNFKKLKLSDKIKTKMKLKEYKRTSPEGIKSLQSWIDSEDEVRALYIKRNEMSEEINNLADTLELMMKENNYKPKYNYRENY